MPLDVTRVPEAEFLVHRRMPAFDLAAVRSGDERALIEALLAMASSWFEAGGWPISAPRPQTFEFLLRGDTAKAGLMAAAQDLCVLLAASPQGREALKDLGLERVAQDLERE